MFSRDYLVSSPTEQVVIEIELGAGKVGEVELGFYPNAAPVTVAHILKLFRLRCYDTNHIFRPPSL